MPKTNTLPRPELTYDGCGINGPDEYRTRIATFNKIEAAVKYGPLFASAPGLLAALSGLLVALNDAGKEGAHGNLTRAEQNARAAISKAGGGA